MPVSASHCKLVGWQLAAQHQLSPHQACWCICLQIQEKMALRILEEEENRMYDAMYEAERLKKEQR